MPLRAGRIAGFSPEKHIRVEHEGLKSVCENWLTHPKGVIPKPVSEACRVGVRDLAFVVESNQTLANHEVPQGDSPAEDVAGSLTPFGMTISSSHTPSEARNSLSSATARFRFALPCLKAWAEAVPFQTIFIRPVLVFGLIQYRLPNTNYRVSVHQESACCESDSTFPSGSLNQATLLPPGALQTPSLS